MTRQRKQNPPLKTAQKPNKAKLRRRSFIVRLAPPGQAEKWLKPQERALLKTGCLGFFLYQRRGGGAADDEQKPLGFCLAREAAGKAANKPFLEIALFRIADKSAEKRGKSLLLRAVGDYCRKRDIDYIFGRFSFAGKYPAAYAQEFSCLYHYYRVKNSAAAPIPPEQTGAKKASMDIMPAEAATPDKTCRLYPPLLRYCLKLGAKTAENVSFDQDYAQGAGTMNVFLGFSVKPAAEAQSVKQKNSSAAPP